MKSWTWNFLINNNDQKQKKGNMNIPPPIQQFIEAGVVAGYMPLPFHYPLLHELEGYQSGFRYHGITGVDLTSTEAGSWQPGWYVIALNGFDDPYFVDLHEEHLNFPVYYATLGTGIWVAIKMADNIEQFGTLLKALQDLNTDEEASLQFLEKHTDLRNELWQEVYEGISTPDEPLTWEPEPSLIRGQLVITDIGPHKLKIVYYLKERFKLSSQEALAMSKQERIVVSEGMLLHMRWTMEKLKNLGTTVIFIADEDR